MWSANLPKKKTNQTPMVMLLVEKYSMHINNGRPRDKKILGFSIIRHLLQHLMELVLVMCFCVQVGVEFDLVYQ